MTSKHPKQWTFGGLALTWVLAITVFDVDSSVLTQVALLGGLGAAIAIGVTAKEKTKST